jgi:hypothetical protein
MAMIGKIITAFAVIVVVAGVLGKYAGVSQAKQIYDKVRNV